MGTGKEIKRLRAISKVSANVLAERIGINVDRLRKWEEKDLEPRHEDAQKIEDFFGVTLAELPKLEHVPKKSRANDNELQIKESGKKEIIALGKHAPLRLKPEDYAKAFGDWKGLPMYNVPVTASFVTTYRDEKVYQPQYYLHDPRFKDCSFGAIITGDSMHSEIRHGDFVVCQEVTDKRFIVYGDIYYVVASNGLETCKYINADPKNDDNLMLIARNEKISPSPIPKDMIDRLYKVRGIVRGY